MNGEDFGHNEASLNGGEPSVRDAGGRIPSRQIARMVDEIQFDCESTAAESVRSSSS